MSRAARRAAVALMLIAVTAICSGCGEVGNKQLRIEGGAIASTASEAAELADQRLRDEVPSRFTRVQAETLATQFGKSLTATTSKPPAPGAIGLVDRASALALKGQLQALAFSDHVDDLARVKAAKDQFSAISDGADALASEAETREARQ